MKAIEEINVDTLVEHCKNMNEVFDSKIEVVGVSTPDLIKSFSVCLEAMSGEEQDKIPEAVEFYNDIYADEKVEPTGDPEKKEPEPEQKASGQKKKKAPAKKKKAPAKKKEPKEPAPPKEKDEYGFTIGTRNNLFMEAIKKQPMTMKEVKELSWNVTDATFYEMFKKMKAAGKVQKDEQGRMSVV